jgi:hypothetical protein
MCTGRYADKEHSDQLHILVSLPLGKAIQLDNGLGEFQIGKEGFFAPVAIKLVASGLQPLPRMSCHASAGCSFLQTE